MSKFKTLINKIVLSALSFLVLFFSLALPVKAQDSQPTPSTSGTWYDQTPYEWYSKVYDEEFSSPTEIFGERYTAAQVQWVVYSIPSIVLNFVTGQNHQLVGCLMGASFITNTGKPTIDVEKCGQGIITALQKTLEFRAIPTLSSNNQNLVVTNNQENLAQLVFADRPLSGIGYFKNLGKKFHIIPRAEAAETGYGFGALGPVNDLWKVARNFAYAIFTIIIVVFSFMIMFRIKINPQTVITIQSALPKIVIAMILVTFSYAIAGLMVDLMYVIFGFLAALIASSGNSIGIGTTNPSVYFNLLTGNFVPVPGLTNVLNGPVNLIVFFVVYIILYLAAIIYSFLAAFLNASIGGALMNIFLLIFSLILIIILVINIFRIFWMLFKTLATIYTTVILGPVQIVLGTVLPGMGFGAWLKKLIAALAVFPVFGLLSYLGFRFLLYSFATSSKMISGDNNVFIEMVRLISETFGGGTWDTSGLVLPGYVWDPPWLGGASLPIAFILMSLSCIMAIPSVAKMIEGFMTGKFDFESAIGESMGPVKWAQGAASKAGMESAGQISGMGLDRLITGLKIQNRGIGTSVYKLRETLQNTGIYRPGDKKNS